MKIREANQSDIKILVNLIRGSFATVAEQFDLNENDNPRCTSFYTEKRVKGDFDNGIRYYILQRDGKAVGSVGMETADEELCYLMRLSVLPEYRGQGLGEKLVRYIFGLAQKAGLKRIRIGVIEEDVRLKKWYEKFGFAQIKTQQFDYLPFLAAFMEAKI